MIYIGFSTQSNKLSARILCRTYRHCGPILIARNKCVLYQFVRYKKIVPISINRRDINILKHFGWYFIKYDGAIINKHLLKSNAITCVQFTKRAIGIKDITIQTPDTLLKYLQTHNTHQ